LSTRPRPTFAIHWVELPTGCGPVSWGFRWLGCWWRFTLADGLTMDGRACGDDWLTFAELAAGGALGICFSSYWKSQTGAMENERPLLTIGELARRVGVPVRTIRFWSDG